MGNSCDGIILIDKNESETSLRAAKEVGQITDVKKVGHAGTLDPFATGLLIVLLGQGTKLSSYLMAGKKEYVATLRLGVETDTQDLTGRTIHTRAVPKISTGWIRECVLGFLGEIEQVPPSYSAVRYKGKRSYKLARQGIKVELPRRRVKIHTLDIVSVSLPDLTINVTCSSGTYIRTLGSDLGKALGPGAHLVALRRIASRPYHIRDAVNLRRSSDMSPEVFRDRVIPLGRALPHLGSIHIDEEMTRKIRNGQRPECGVLMPGLDSEGFYKNQITLLRDSELVAIAQVPPIEEKNGGRVEILRVFHE